MEIIIEKLNEKDAEKLFEFENKNREYFEKMVPSRGADYYSFEKFKNIHQSLLHEQANGLSYFYLIKNKKGAILGRINVVDIYYSKSIGNLGYRVGQKYVGQGIASRALQLLLNMILEEGCINQLNAKTTKNNIASQRLLEKNGFIHVNTNNETVEMNGKQLGFVNYKWTALLN